MSAQLYCAYAAFASNSKAVDPTGRVRRGYMFSSDEYADSGNVPSFTYDAGADAYEQIRFLEAAYENRYVLDSFRRNRTDFNSDAVTERIQEHYLDTVQLIAKAFAFGAVLDGDPSQPSTDFLDAGNREHKFPWNDVLMGKVRVEAQEMHELPQAFAAGRTCSQSQSSGCHSRR